MTAPTRRDSNNNGCARKNVNINASRLFIDCYFNDLWTTQPVCSCKRGPCYNFSLLQMKKMFLNTRLFLRRCVCAIVCALMCV